MVSEQQTNPYIFGDPVLDRQRLEAISRVLSEHIRRHAYDWVGKDVRRILDVGCGDGQLGCALQDLYPGSELVGIDRDEKAVATARQRAEASGRKASFVQGDVQEGLPGGAYDVVLCFNIFEHLPRYKQAVGLLVAAMAEGGSIWAHDSAADCFAGYPNPDYQKLGDIYPKALAALGNNFYAVNELPDLLKQHGITDIQTYKVELPIGGDTSAGQDLLAGIIGGVYTARAGLSKLTGISEEEIGQMMEGIANDALMNPTPGQLRLLNVVARKTEVTFGEG